GEGERKGGEQADPAEHEPGLVPVPDWRDGIHDQRALLSSVRQPVEHADAEIEAVEEDVEEHAHAEDDSPERHEVERHHAPVIGSAVTGSRGRPLSIPAGSTDASLKPRATTRAMRVTPAGKMMRYTATYPASDKTTSAPVSEGVTESAVRRSP